MKKLLIFTLALFLVTACKKETETTNAATGKVSDPNEVSLVQETSKLQNDKGEVMGVTYFAQGDNVAVKLEQEGKPEEILIAKKINTKLELRQTRTAVDEIDVTLSIKSAQGKYYPLASIYDFSPLLIMIDDYENLKDWSPKNKEIIQLLISEFNLKATNKYPGEFKG